MTPYEYFQTLPDAESTGARKLLHFTFSDLLSYKNWEQNNKISNKRFEVSTTSCIKPVFYEKKKNSIARSVI